MAICGNHKAAVMLILEFRRKLIERMDVKELIGTAAKETAKHVEAKEILKPDDKPKKFSVFGGNKKSA